MSSMMLVPLAFVLVGTGYTDARESSSSAPRVRCLVVEPHL